MIADFLLLADLLDGSLLRRIERAHQYVSNRGT